MRAIINLRFTYLFTYCDITAKRPGQASVGPSNFNQFQTYNSYNKKDGYRQQNVRQRQKLISIIDYDVCMNFY